MKSHQANMHLNVSDRPTGAEDRELRVGPSCLVS